jgi:RimJ/RimL family protein N-acetyltransferase
MNKVFFETHNVSLRYFNHDDGLRLFDLDSDPEVMRYLSNGRPSTKEDVEAAIGRIFKCFEVSGGKFGFWLAFEKSTDLFMGWFLFRPDKKTPHNFDEIELGYRLKKKFWGKGHASEVSKEFLKLGFEKYKVKTIFAKTMKKNLASQKVMQKIGLKFELEFIEEEFPGLEKEAVRYSLKIDEYVSSLKL